MREIERKGLCSVVKIVHLLVVLFISFGFLLPKEYLWIHLCGWPLIRIHWLMNNNYCILSQIEIALTKHISIKKAGGRGCGGPRGNAALRPEDDDLYHTRKLMKWLGFEGYFDDHALERLPLIPLTLSWLISFVRFMVYVVQSKKTTINCRDWVLILIAAYVCGFSLSIQPSLR